METSRPGSIVGRMLDVLMIVITVALFVALGALAFWFDRI